MNHPEEAARFYRSLAGRPVRVGLEATGNFRWFQRLLGQLGEEMFLGDASAIHASNPRKQRTDKRDARHILKLLVEDRFPAVWQPPAENQQLRQLLLHRSGLVRVRTRIQNRLDAVAKNEGLLGRRHWSEQRRRQIEALSLPGWEAERRRDLLALLDDLDRRIAPLDKAVIQAAGENADACRLMTHPGVGPIVALAYVLVIGDWRRFRRGKQVGSYLELIPEEGSSGETRRLGKITKQGNGMVRWLLVEAASNAQRHDADWHRQYVRLSMTKHHGVAKVATAQAGGSAVLDVALRGRLPAGPRARFACGAVRVPHWCCFRPIG